MRAVIVQEGKTVAVEERPTPTLAENEILVEVKAVAQNPTDWKHVKNTPMPGTILGCDFSGIVVQVAKGCKSDVAVGDHVAGFIMGGHFEDRGAFANYLKTDSDLVWTVPKGTVSHEQAATMGCALWTAIQAFFHPTRLALVEPPSRVTARKWVFIYGGSTSVGLFAIQLAHIAGYKVATVASPQNHSLLKSLGADVVGDYKSPDIVSQIKKATNDDIHAALDTISSPASQSLCVHVLGPGAGKVITLGPANDTAKSIRSDVEVNFTLIYTALGRQFDFGPAFFPASPEDRAHMAQFLPTLETLVKNGAIKPNEVKLWKGGLDSIWDGLKYMMDGKVSAEKLVYNP